jgi:ribonuclease D
MPLLRPLMADPAVLKVLHGGANDIAWLQRDAHVYLVNVFDTERAAQVNDNSGVQTLVRKLGGKL